MKKNEIITRINYGFKAWNKDVFVIDTEPIRTNWYLIIGILLLAAIGMVYLPIPTFIIIFLIWLIR